jgi:hypothetical protein
MRPRRLLDEIEHFLTDVWDSRTGSVAAAGR